MVNKAKEVVMKLIKSIKPATENIKLYLKAGIEKVKLLNGNLTEKIKKLNIREKLFKLLNNIKKIVKLIKNYNYRNTGRDLKNLSVYIKNTTINKVGSEKSISFVSKMNERVINLSAVCILAFFVVAAACASNLDFGYKVVCNGKTVAITHDRETALLAYSEAEKELAGIEGASQANAKIVFAIANEEFFQNEECASNSIIAAFDGKKAAFGIYADGVLVVSVNSEKEAQEVLEAYKNEYKKDGVLEIGFNKKVEILQARVSAGDIKSKADAALILKQPAGGVKIHEVKDGETISEIAEKLGTTTNKILALNPELSPEMLQIGTKLIVSDNTPVIAVKTKEHTKELEKIAYETNKVEDKNTYKGITIVVSDGEYGEKEVDYDVYKENGVVTTKVATAENVLKNPVTKQVKVGSKAKPKTASTGSFMNPFYGGIVTSRYGSRSRGFHTGIDLAGKTGSPVYAADGGTVTFAGWSGGYGKVIKIKHDNGYETYYAHLSSINVSNGTKVAKGSFIGRVGNTGNSTGPHLHFEIRKNGQTLNPGSYIGR